VNVAAVSIGSSFGSTLTGLTWVVDVYVLTFASLLLLAGSLATAFGSRRLYLVGMIVFLVASIGCAIAPSEATLIAARAVEGIGAALFMPSSLALLVGTFTEPGQRAKMLGLWSAMVATSAAIGPTVGGVLVSAFGWRSIFLINVPVVVAGMVLTARVIPSTPGTGQRVSPVGNLLFFVVVASGAYVLIQGRSSGFDARWVIFAAALLVIGGLILIVEQARTATPVMPWNLFARPAFGVPNVVGFLYSGALYGNLYLMGLFLQNARHLSAFEAGLHLLPMTVCFPLGNILYTRIHHRVGNATIMALCLLIAGIATLLLVPAAPSTPYW
jgi:DHA2 family methylenomycin A resistance protein-like MFS transporter